MPDKIDRAKADCAAALNEFDHASEQLVDRLLQLGDRPADELAARLLVSVAHMTATEQALTEAALEVLQELHEKQLEVLGSNRQDAARRLLEAAGRR